MIYKQVDGYDCWGRPERDHEPLIELPEFSSFEEECEYCDKLNRRFASKDVRYVIRDKNWNQIYPPEGY